MKRDCPGCDGEGTIDVSVTPQFNTRAEQWYPDEETRICPTCNGEKSVDKPTHENLFNLSADYLHLEQRRGFRRSAKNSIALGILGEAA